MKLPYTVDLTGKVAVVTGGSGVLCSHMAKALAACGARVAILGRNLQKAQAVAEEIGDNALAFSADVLDVSSLKAAQRAIHDVWGKVSILINGAGGNNPLATTEDEQYELGAEAVKDFFQLDPEGIKQVMDVNFLGTVLPTQVFAKEMAGTPGACVVNISSMASYQPMTKVMSYSGAKAAINNFTMWLATYFAKTGLRVNAIAPGFFATQQNKTMLFEADGSPTARTGKILAATPMGRLGEPHDLIGALLFLVSEEAAGFVTGITIPVDGGFMAYAGV